MADVTTPELEDKAKVKAQIVRMKAALGVKKDKDLSAAFGISDTRIAGKWAKNGKIPDYIFMLCYELTGASIDWLYGVRRQLSQAQTTEILAQGASKPETD